MFKPTWLYIKQHNKTGLKYFGKTIRDLHKYKGSGRYWNRHLKKHGNDVSTVWRQLFENKEELTRYALTFSNEQNIVNSREWANEKVENGLDGGCDPGHLKGVPKSDKHRASLKEARNRRGPDSKDTKHRKSLAASKPRSILWKKSASEHRKGKPTWNKGGKMPLGFSETMSLLTKGENNPMFGKKHTADAKEKQRQARLGKLPSNKGVPRTNEQKLAQSLSMKGRPAHNKGVPAKLATCKYCGQTSTVGAIGRYHKNCGA